MTKSIGTLLRFADLKARKIATTYTVVTRLVENEGFPPGRLLSPNCRVWTEEEIADWLATRPTERKPMHPRKGNASHEMEAA